MGYKGNVRSIIATANRIQKAHEKALREQQKQEQLHQAQSVISQQEYHLNQLTSLHEECNLAINWEEIIGLGFPEKPAKRTIWEDAAKRALAEYNPNFLDRLFNNPNLRRQKLKAAIVAAREKDNNTYQSEIAEHKKSLQELNRLKIIGKKLLSNDGETILEVIREFGLLSEIKGIGKSIQVRMSESGLLEGRIHVNGPEIIPDELITATKTGIMSRKPMPKAKGNELYQDHVCSATIRVARELFAVTPYHLVLIHAEADLLNSATGHLELRPILSVAFRRQKLMAMKFDSIDCSDAVQTFEYRMNFKSRSGFQHVERLQPSELKGNT